MQHNKRNQNSRQLPSSGPSVGEEKQKPVNQSVHVINCSHNLKIKNKNSSLLYQALFGSENKKSLNFFFLLFVKVGIWRIKIQIQVNISTMNVD